MIAFLFPGQGAQYRGMGVDLAARAPEAAALYERASRVLGFDLLALCAEGSDEELRATENTQPAILITTLAAAAALAARGIRPGAAAGLSLGEYAAFVAAGALDVEDAVALVRQRGLFMAEATAGRHVAMAAVMGLEADALEALCRDHRHLGVVEPANFNGGGQVVIGGDAAAVRAVMAAARRAGARRAVFLSVSAPFHTSLMAPAATRLAPLLEGAPFRDARFPVVTNATAEPVQRADRIRELLRRQVASPVRWEASMRRLSALGVTIFIEAGPGTTLSGLLRRVLPEATIFAVQDGPSLDRAVESLGAMVS